MFSFQLSLLYAAAYIYRGHLKYIVKTIKFQIDDYGIHARYVKILNCNVSNTRAAIFYYIACLIIKSAEQIK